MGVPCGKANAKQQENKKRKQIFKLSLKSNF